MPRAMRGPRRRKGFSMREVFHQSLEDVQYRLVEIAELVTVAIDKATRAFGTSDVGLAEEVIADDAHIDERAIALDEIAIEILARQQPVARDLRIVVTALRVSASLERMGDLAEHIAQLARYRFPERAVPKGLKGTFARMGELDVDVARKLTELLRTQDLTARRGDPQRRRCASTSCTSACSRRCSARTGRAKRSRRSTPRWRADTTSGSPTTPSPSRRGWSTSPRATGRPRRERDSASP